MTQRLALISPFFFPEAISSGRYNTFLAKELASRGVELDVMAMHPFYPEWRPRKSDSSLPGMLIRRNGHWIRFPKRTLLRRLLLESYFAWCALVALIRFRRRYDRIVLVVPPSLFALFTPLLATEDGTIVIIVHDLQGVHVARGSAGRARKLVQQMVGVLERHVFQRANKLVFLSRQM